jgi:hypothetical protein
MLIALVVALAKSLAKTKTACPQDRGSAALYMWKVGRILMSLLTKSTCPATIALNLRAYQRVPPGRFGSVKKMA